MDNTDFHAFEECYSECDANVLCREMEYIKRGVLEMFQRRSWNTATVNLQMKVATQFEKIKCRDIINTLLDNKMRLESDELVQTFPLVLSRDYNNLIDEMEQEISGVIDKYNEKWNTVRLARLQEYEINMAFIGIEHIKEAIRIICENLDKIEESKIEELKIEECEKKKLIKRELKNIKEAKQVLCETLRGSDDTAVTEDKSLTKREKKYEQEVRLIKQAIGMLSLKDRILICQAAGIPPLMAEEIKLAQEVSIPETDEYINVIQDLIKGLMEV